MYSILIFSKYIGKHNIKTCQFARFGFENLDEAEAGFLAFKEKYKMRDDVTIISSWRSSEKIQDLNGFVG